MQWIQHVQCARKGSEKKMAIFLQSMLLHYSRFGIPLIKLEKNPIEAITSGMISLEYADFCSYKQN